MTTIAALGTRALGSEFSAGYQADAERYVRAAIGRIYRTTTLARGDYTPAAVTLALGALGVVLSEPGIRISSVTHVDTGEPLTEADVDTLTAAQNVTTPPRGRPAYYAISDAGLTAEGITLMCLPIPDRAYQLLVTGRFAPPATELESTDTVPLPADYEDIPTYWAKHRLFDEDSDREMSDHWLERWASALMELRGDLQKRSTNNRQIPGHWAGATSTAPSFHHPRGLF